MLNNIFMDAAAIPYAVGDFVGPAEIFTAVLIVVVIAVSVARIIRAVNKRKNNDKEQ